MASKQQTEIVIRDHLFGFLSIQANGEELVGPSPYDVEYRNARAYAVDTEKLLRAITKDGTVFVSVCVECKKAYRVTFDAVNNGHALVTSHGYCDPCCDRVLRPID